MSETVIRVEHLGKRYRLGERETYKTMRDSISEAMAAPMRRLRGESSTRSKEPEFIWALKDISFEVKQGEVIGIIGRNGSGKSTLLKILSRITTPTRGWAEIYGVVNSLLEVGTGFHPELSGRENVYLNGAILGMPKSEINSKFDDIVEFSEIEEFLDTPVKHYSSGMRLRLAFSVAAHLEPEILILDEVLAVGDVAFQRKCLGKIGQVARAGRTVLIVSHSMTPVANMCDKAIWLNDGEIVMQGRPFEVIAGYLSFDSSTSGEMLWPEGLALDNVDELEVLSLRVLNHLGEVAPGVGIRQPFFIEIGYRVKKPLPRCRVGFLLNSSEGFTVFEGFDADDPRYGSVREPGMYVARCEIPAHLLNVGRYMLSLRASMPDKALVAVDNVLAVHTAMGRQEGVARVGQQRRGIVWPDLRWECTRDNQHAIDTGYADRQYAVVEGGEI